MTGAAVVLVGGFARGAAQAVGTPEGRAGVKKAAILGGCDLASQAIVLRPDLRILYTTGNRVTDKMKALFITGTHFLSKPYTQQQLKVSVGEMLAA